MSFGDKFYTFSEAARALGCSRQNVCQRVKRGSIPTGEEEGKRGVPKGFVEEILGTRFELVEDEPGYEVAVEVGNEGVDS